MRQNRQILLVSRPTGFPELENFKLVEKEIPSIQDGEVLLRSLYLSVDPYMRERMYDVATYAEPYPLNEPFIGDVVGEIVESKNEKYAVGDYVVGRLDWADYSVSDGTDYKGEPLRKLSPNEAPISTALHVLGMPGRTAFFGMEKIGQPKEGETVVISGAAGAVGTVAGQIGKIKGCRVVGIAGSDLKVKYLTEDLGFDAAINYKTENVDEALKAACPQGVDVYFDNVGGTITDIVSQHLNDFSRIILCGQISQYNLEKPDYGPRIQRVMLHRRALMKGFIVSDYASENEVAIKQLTKWVSEGKIKYRENIVEGLENAPRAFIGLFKGENIGKQLVKV